MRGRLLLALLAVACVGLLAADVATYVSLRSFLYHRVDQTLADDTTSVASRVLDPHGRIDANDVAAAAPGAFVQLRDRGGNAVFTVKQGNGEVAPAPRLPDTLTAGGDDWNGRTFFAPGESGGRFRVRVSEAPFGSVVIGLPLADTHATLGRLLAIEAVVTVGALGAAAALGLWLVQVGLRPLHDIETVAEGITAGDLDRRVPDTDANTEVGRLGRAFNGMLTRIQEAFAQRDATEARLRRFVADASHELRTPLSAVSAYAELFERGASERPEDLQRVMGGIRAETGRMGALVEDLLLLARLDEGRPLERVPVDLVRVAAEAVDTARAVGPEWPAALVAPAPVEVMGDPLRLRQVLDNLLANVRTHTPAGTRAIVSVTAADGRAAVEVSDNGPGMAPEQAARVFERFYRTDASRSRHSGGTGLGLAIVDAIVRAHHGVASVSSVEGGGTTFRIELPVAPELPAPDPAPASVTA